MKSVELPIEALTFGFSNVELNKFTEQEFKMIASDKQEKERADSRNALEEYVYELRGKMQSEDDLGPYILESDRDIIVRQLDDMETWLYEDGEDCNKQVNRTVLELTFDDQSVFCACVMGFDSTQSTTNHLLQVYIDKLAELKSKGEPVQQRKIECELRPAIVEDFARSLQLCMKALELIRYVRHFLYRVIHVDSCSCFRNLYKGGYKNYNPTFLS